MTTAANDDRKLSAKILLALAKDERYIEQGRRILAQIWEDLHHSSSAGNNNNTTLDWAPWVLSASLYVVLTSSIIRGNKNNDNHCTLGMAQTGLEFVKSATTRRLWQLGATMGFLAVGASMWSKRNSRQNDDTNNTTANNNNLRGSQRRQAFEQSRRRMMERAQQQQQEQEQQHMPPTPTEQRTPISGDRNSGVAQTTTMMAQRLQKWGYESIQSIIHAVSSCSSTGPHDLAFHESTFSVGVWFLRLRLALLCLGVLHPAGVQTSSPKGRLHSSDNSLRLAGLLILSHAAGQLLRALSRAWVKRAVQRKLQTELPTTETVASTTTGSSEEEKSGRITKDTSITTAVVCAVCQEPRMHPACSVKCGHVLCWKCWQLWVANKAECPICRTPTRPQEILALENYSATAAD
mmetsp:Transcript_29563/g.81257  ORF Transcript_29563/g.81257 Transcript_29563/m.81257 type:complete len:407 (+) Transcript_29563:91-1311(+)